MNTMKWAIGLGMIGALGACQSIPKDMSVADYCADTRNQFENVCRLNTEIDGNRVALADTDMRLSQARAIADSAMQTANRAQGTADGAMVAASRAQATADGALRASQNAMLREDQLFCETRTIQKTDTGTCAPGYTLMSCAQTRYTFRAGGLSFLREINGQSCRFDQRVLEMKVRCCMAGAQAAPSTAVQAPADEPRPVRRNMRVSESRY